MVFTACAPRQTPLPQDSSSTQQVDNTTIEVTTHPLDEEQTIESLGNPMLASITDPWQLVELSRDQPIAERNILLLRAIELFLDQQHLSTAFTLLDQFDTTTLGSEQRIQVNLLRARYALLSGNTDLADSILHEVINGGTMNQGNYKRLLELDIAIAEQQQNTKRAVTSRLNLDPLLDETPRIENQRLILSSLSSEPGLFSFYERNTADNILKGWLDLAALKQTQPFDQTQLDQWQERYPNHPAQITALGALISGGPIAGGPITSNQIALLLPLTSRLGKAAQAFKAGFEAAIEANGHFDTSRVYDFGSEDDLVGFYYQSAVNEGADFVVGPLGRKSVQALLNYLNNPSGPYTSTMVLGELTPIQNNIPNVWGLALSPEQDAVAIAERAINLGLRQALVMEKNNAWGARVSAAFTAAFEERGGSVVGKQRFLPGQQDHSVEVKNLLNINASEIRHARLQDLVGRQLEFSVRRRDDVDFIFLAGNNKDARNILPLVKFYRGHTLPVYATATAAGRKFNKLADEDLKGMHFADLPWLLNALAPAAISQGTTSNGLPARQLPYASPTLNRLYALGYAAFEVIPQLNQLQTDQYYQFQTPVMSLRMDETRNLQHEVGWGEYTADNIAVSAQ